MGAAEHNGKTDTASEILEAATDLFARQGYGATSIQAVADQVGIRKQSLLYHFPTKAALRDGVLRSFLSHWKDSIPAALLQTKSPEGRLDAALGLVREFFLADPNRARLIIREVLDRPEEMRALFSEHIGPWIGIVTEYIRKGQQHGAIYDDLDPESFIAQSVVDTVCVIASASVYGGIYPSDCTESEALERLITENQRRTRVSLFKQERPSQASTNQPLPETPSERGA